MNGYEKCESKRSAHVLMEDHNGDSDSYVVDRNWRICVFTTGTAIWNYGRPIVMVGSVFVFILLVVLGRKVGTLKPITAIRYKLIVWGAVVGIALISGIVVPLLVLR